MSVFENVDTISDIHGNDVKLDLCLTPDRIYDFRNA
jgi:5-formyltetrahydrofolate cyclo-ligase